MAYSNIKKFKSYWNEREYCNIVLMHQRVIYNLEQDKVDTVVSTIGYIKTGPTKQTH